jgi:hypothetical protein
VKLDYFFSCGSLSAEISTKEKRFFMTQSGKEKDVADLLLMQEQAKSAIIQIRQLADQINNRRRNLLEFVERYGIKRLALFVSEMNARELTWCPRCLSIILSNTVKKPVLFDNGSQKTLAMVCTPCYDIIKRGIFHTADDVRAFAVENVGSSFYFITHENCRVLLKNYLFDDPQPSVNLVNKNAKIAREWGIPLQMELQIPPPNEEIVVREKIVIREE